MATPINNFVITKEGLSKVCKELADSRVFNNNLINTEGTLTSQEDKSIVEGFSTANYFYYDNLSINSEDLIISTKCTFFTSENNQCLWSLGGVETPSIFLQFSNNSISLYSGETLLCEISGVSLLNQTPISTKVRLTSNTCELQVFFNGQLYHKIAPTSEITLSNFSQILVGTNESLSWNGYINMSTFVISSTKGLIYAPSIDNFFQFIKVMVGDGSIPLINNPGTSEGHIYTISSGDLDIENFGNGIIIKCSLGKEATLTIREIALFDVSGEEPQIFALASNLNIFKPSDTSYSLIFDINLDINIVNISGFPNAGDIIVKEIEYINSHDFERFKEAHAFGVSCLERLVQQNAAELATNTPQEYYRLEQSINTQEEGYNAVENLAWFNKNLSFESIKEFDEESITLKGDISVPSNGIASSFSSSDYLERDDYYLNTYEWEYVVNFNSSEDSLGEIQCLGSPCVNQPYELYIEKFGDVNYCMAKLGGKEHIEVTYDGASPSTIYNRYPLEDYSFYLPVLIWENPAEDEQFTTTTWNNAVWTEAAKQNFAAWIDENWTTPGYSTKYLNRLDSSESIETVTDATFNSISDKKEWTFNPDLDTSAAWTFSIPVEFFNDGAQYILGTGNDIYPNFRIMEIFIDSNKKLKFSPYYLSSSTQTSRIEGSPLTSTNNIKTGYQYNITVGYDGYKYSLSYTATFINMYAWTYNNHTIYSRSTHIDQGTKLYKSDWTFYTGSNFAVTEIASDEFKITYNGNETSRDEANDIVPPSEEVSEISETVELTSSTLMYWPDTSKPFKLIIGGTYASSSYSSSLHGYIENLSRVLLSSNYSPIWGAYVPLMTVYTANYDPSVPRVYDTYGTLINNSELTLNNQTNKYVFPSELLIGTDKRLFPIQSYTKYFIKLTSHFDTTTNKYVYNFYRSLDGENYELVKSITPSSIPINDSKYLVIGGQPVYEDLNLTSVTNPYNGSTDLLDWYLDVNGSIWDMWTENVLQDATLSQYYHIPKLNLLTYSVNDLCDFTHKLNIEEATFTGNSDIIDFNNEKGVSLLIKAFLQDMEDKVILVKKDSEDNPYFTLELKNKELVFTLFTDGSPYVLSKPLALEEYASFTESPILISVTYNGSYYNPEFKMYRNNEEISNTASGTGGLLAASDYVLSNTIGSEEPSTIYVTDIIFLEGIITPENLYKVNNLLDTNF